MLIVPKCNEKKLLKFGFEPQYDVETGKISGYISKRYKIGQRIFIFPLKKKIRFFKNIKNDCCLDESYLYENDYFSKNFDLDLLYDLIKNNIIKKSERN